MMRNIAVLLFFYFLLLWHESLFAQVVVPERPGVILISVTASQDSAIDATFRSARPQNDPTFAHSDINSCRLSNDTLISRLLGIRGLHGLMLHPFIPTHSVAFEDIRERSNPQLFGKGTYSIANPNESAKNNSELAIAESKVSHWFYLFYSDSITPERAMVLAKKSAVIDGAEQEFIRKPLYTPNDSLVSQQYSLSLMNVFQAWDVVRCDSTMIVADADIGTDWTHEDLQASIYQNPGEIGIDQNGVDKRANGIDDDSNGFVDDWHGWDFGGVNGATPDNNAEPGDGVNHGTQTAGILAATGDNHVGIAGVAFGARIIPIKISDNSGGLLDFGFQGIVYAADMHAELVNCSWGGPGQSSAEQAVIDYAYAKNCAVIAAAGNSGGDFPYEELFPGSYRHVLSCAAVDENGNVETFSNYNTEVDIAAPGVDIYSSTPDNGYEGPGADGTSFACPNTAGVVALVRQRFPNFSAGQAMEQVRVTGNPLHGLDSGRVFFEGHGIVDAHQAVTDTNTFSARVDTVTIEGASGTGSLQAGEMGSIIIRAMNFLKPLNQLKARLQVVVGADYVSLDQNIVPFGAVGTLQTISNAASAFQLHVADSTPPNTSILIRVFFYDSTVGYAEDYDYIQFVIRPTYLDLNANNLTVTFSSIGSIGYNDVMNNSEGSGFFWRNAPKAVQIFGRQVIYEGGLMVGTDPNHVVDVVVGAGGTPDEDLEPQALIHYVTPPDRRNAAQELSFSLTDGLADPSIAIGLNATCRAYAYTQGLAANAVVAQYILHGTPGGLLSMTDSASAALYFDWDIGPSGGLNVTQFDSSTMTAITYREEPNYPYIGLRLLSAVPKGASPNYYAMMNDGSQGGIDVYSSFTRQEKWQTMTQFFPSAGVGDISHTFGLRGMPVHSEDSVEVTVAIALAEDRASLMQTLDETTNLWYLRADVQMMQVPTTLEIFPNPFQDNLHISWSATGTARVTICDAIGRIIVSQQVIGSTFDFAAPDVPSGFYVVDVEVAGTHLRREVVSAR
ncbi:MAG TPA: S8 family serine peptidase [Candidatus Kapabacteria bacterium]